mmetsp:Transcript_91653/g.285665  ORF Transcript_91653/g.285665 Transcript_91653/m.285665 type:complete len:364 (+) Transcript_91653:632-1723(+)
MRVGTIHAFAELKWERPQGEVLHVAAELAVHAIEVGVLVQLLVRNTGELPAVFDTKFLLRIAVDREVVRDNWCHIVVLDAEGPVHGVDCPDGAVVVEVQPQALRLRGRRLRQRRCRLGLGRSLGRWHRLVDWLRLPHHPVEATEATAERQKRSEECQPPRQAEIEPGDGGAHRLVADALARLEVCYPVDRAGAWGRDPDVARSAQPPPTAAVLRCTSRHHRNCVAGVHSLPLLDLPLLEDVVHLRAHALLPEADLRGLDLAYRHQVLVLGRRLDAIAYLELVHASYNGARPPGRDVPQCSGVPVLQDGNRLLALHVVADVNLPLFERPSTVDWSIGPLHTGGRIEGGQATNRCDAAVLQQLLE